MSYFRQNIEALDGYVPGFQPQDSRVVKLNLFGGEIHTTIYCSTHFLTLIKFDTAKDFLANQSSIPLIVCKVKAHY